jgi:hypothetical protein
LKTSLFLAVIVTPLSSINCQVSPYSANYFSEMFLAATSGG